MGRTLKRLNLLLRRVKRQNLLLYVLIAGSLAFVTSMLADLATYVRAAGSLREALPTVLSFEQVAQPILASHFFQFLLLLVVWGYWLRIRRRRQVQERLRRSEQKYRQIINHAGEAIFLLEEGGRILEWNKAAESLFGEPRRDVLHRPFRDVHLCFAVEIEKAMADARRLHRSLSFEFPFPRGGRQDGQISLTISPIITGIRPDEDTPLNFVVIARDITSEKQLEDKMSETEKLAGIGQLAAGIAHQLNTPLGSILLSAQMLEETVQGEDEEEDVRRIIRQTEQCRIIIKGVLNFARPTGKERGMLNMGEVIRETVFLMEKNLKLAGVTVAVDEQCDLQIHGNRNELDQVFFNLLANALDAMPRGGALDISIRNGSPGEGLVVFADAGEGIPAEHRDRIFLPFFTTKEYGKGTGLGLSIVARIVHEHGGRIEVESAEGAGTSFSLSFPLPGYGLPGGRDASSGD